MSPGPSTRRSGPPEPGAEKRWKINFADDDNSIMAAVTSIVCSMLIGLGLCLANSTGGSHAVQYGLGFGCLGVGIFGLVYVLATSRAGNWLGVPIVGIIIYLICMNMGVFRPGEVGGLIIAFGQTQSLFIAPLIADGVFMAGLFGLVGIIWFPTG